MCIADLSLGEVNGSESQIEELLINPGDEAVSEKISMGINNILSANCSTVVDVVVEGVEEAAL